MSSVHLVDFLKARLDEDERVARAATTSPWRIDPRNPNVILEPTPIDSVGMTGDRQHNIFTGQLSSRFGQAKLDATHIARHDPARVLADVAAKRAILRNHGDQHDCGDPRSYDYPYVGCCDLRQLAMPYADHPDYRQEWKP